MRLQAKDERCRQTPEARGSEEEFTPTALRAIMVLIHAYFMFLPPNYLKIILFCLILLIYNIVLILPV